MNEEREVTERCGRSDCGVDRHPLCHFTHNEAYCEDADKTEGEFCDTPACHRPTEEGHTMSKTKKVFDDSMKVSGGWARGLREVDNSFGRYLDGDVGTRYGFAHVYHEPENQITRIDVIHDSRLHMRTIKGATYTKDGLVRLASKFAREIAEGGA